MSSKTRKKVNSNRARHETQAKSYSEEADVDLKEAKRFIQNYERLGLSLWLRKAIVHLKMAADRDDHSEHLRGNTLEEYVKK